MDITQEQINAKARELFVAGGSPSGPNAWADILLVAENRLRLESCNVKPTSPPPAPAIVEMPAVGPDEEQEPSLAQANQELAVRGREVDPNEPDEDEDEEDTELYGKEV